MALTQLRKPDIGKDRKVEAEGKKLATSPKNNNGNGSSHATNAIAINVVFRLIAGAALLGLGAVGTIAFNHEGRLSGVEHNRFTSNEGLAIANRIGALETVVAGMPKEVPPKWLETRVHELGDDQDDLRKMVFDMNNNLVNVVQKLNDLNQRLERFLENQGSRP